MKPAIKSENIHVHLLSKSQMRTMVLEYAHPHWLVISTPLKNMKVNIIPDVMENTKSSKPPTSDQNGPV